MRSDTGEPLGGDWIGDWISVSVTEDGRPRPLVVGTSIELDLGRDSVSATLGCNRLTAPCTIVDDALVLHGPVAVTRRGCTRERHDQDAWFGRLLGARPTLRREGGSLHLTTSEGVRIEFLAAVAVEPDRPLLGTRWTVTGFVDHGTVMALSSPRPGSLQLHADPARAEVVDGNEAFTAAYEATEIGLHFHDVPAPTMAAAAGSYVDRFRSVLGGDVAWHIDRDRLALTRNEHGVLFVESAATAAHW